MAFDMAAAFRSDLPPAGGPWSEPPPFSFVGGHNDGPSVPVAGLTEAAVSAIGREGRNLATYNLGDSPLGYLPLRAHLAESLAARASMPCDPDEILITSGSLQALDLVNEAMLSPGDTVLVEEATYGGALTRLERFGVDIVGVTLDEDGIVIEALEATLEDLAAKGVRPRFLYTIPTVQNPTGSVMPVDRRHRLLELTRRFEVPVFEDECYADLTWGVERPPTLRAIDRRQIAEGAESHVIYCGSFSKSIAPALRVGYIVADPDVILRLLALKTDAGTGALEQLTLAEYAPRHFDAHVTELTATLHAKCEVMVGALREAFGDGVTIDEPQGGIYVWVAFTGDVDTTALAGAAAEAGIEFNPGEGWSVDPDYGRRRLRLCFGHPDADTIRAGVAALAEVVAAQG
ncbi:MAG: PLP-dependent aminotransferase family protein [Actinomycetota bacterium]